MQSTSVYYKKTENPYLLYRGFKGGDDIFDTKTLTFAVTVSTEFFTLSDKLVIPGGVGGGGNSHMKQTGMPVISLRGIKSGFWSRLGCSEQSANISCRQSLA